ncbi:HNH endonuclease [Halorubrum lipolyticum]|uniref:Restriction endonuclease-like protein n=1 Tax=Halorubrum lipolyticum DSM 21995 TaxID=1227482 RepID=M0NXA8_9EURY|nr:HNH endonuclease [Halorubrum lipolyticum]EMA62451.1 restriction endonuclease-like protein [Halorubrum lipolyticum DSM 21995]
METAPVAVGDRLAKAEIEEAFDTGFGYQISGINPRRDARDRRYVLLFATEDGPYDDDVTRGRFEYVGEGLDGDQSETSPGNSTLIDAVDGGIPVHFFYKPTDAKEWEYHGLVSVVDHEFEERDGRDVIVFTMENRSAEPDSEPSDDAGADANAAADPPKLTVEEDRFVESRRRERDPEFVEDVRAAYDRTCVVCGRRRETPDGRPEVEAAHVYPKAERGVDEVRNGVTLCRLHHWAFDAGWIAFTDDYEVVVKDAPEREGYYEFKQLEGDSLVFPEGSSIRPHPDFVAKHRERHGF